MTPPVFLADLTGVAAGATVLLDGPEGRHAATVRRLVAGERADLTDGRGALAECLVVSAARDSLELKVLLRKDSAQPALSLTVVQALPKGDRGELAVDLLTEVGVDRIVPWAAARCVTQWKGERGDKALDKWRAHAREAGKQSRRVWWPEVTAAASTREVAALIAGTNAFVLHESATSSLATQEIPYEGSVVLVVGPEGGITDDELAAFTAAGAVTVQMGPAVMRTSTAGVAAAAVVLARSGRWA